MNGIEGARETILNELLMNNSSQVPYSIQPVLNIYISLMFIYLEIFAIAAPIHI